MSKPVLWQVLFLSTCLYIAGCQVTHPDSSLSAEHPAHPEAFALDFVVPELLLGEPVKRDPVPAAGGQHDHSSAPEMMHHQHTDSVARDTMHQHHMKPAAKDTMHQHHMKPAAKDTMHHQMKPAAKDTTHNHHGGHG